MFDITFRRVRVFFITSRIPHWLKLTIGGLGTALCGLAFVTIYDGPLIPIGPNYEAVRYVLKHPLPTEVLLVFVVLKLLATIFTLGTGGVSAMFVPLLLVGGALGNAYAQSVVHAPTHDLYAAVGMAAFIAAGYKTPLTAVVFVAETTGGHSYIIPSLIGAAVAYAISGEASVSGDQHLHETAKLAELSGMAVRDVIQRRVVSVQAASTIREFVASVAAHHRHTIFPVYEIDKVVGTISISDLSQVPPEDWDKTTVGEFADRNAVHVMEDCDLSEALRLLVRERGAQMLLVTDERRRPARNRDEDRYPARCEDVVRSAASSLKFGHYAIREQAHRSEHVLVAADSADFEPAYEARETELLFQLSDPVDAVFRVAENPHD